MQKKTDQKKQAEGLQACSLGYRKENEMERRVSEVLIDDLPSPNSGSYLFLLVHPGRLPTPFGVGIAPGYMPAALRAACARFDGLGHAVSIVCDEATTSTWPYGIPSRSVRLPD